MRKQLGTSVIYSPKSLSGVIELLHLAKSLQMQAEKALVLITNRSNTFPTYTHLIELK